MMTQEGEQPPQQQGTSQESAAREGSAAFLRAARAGNIERVLELLRAGTDINTCNANGLNALHLASKEGHHEVVRELLRRKANVDAATKKGNTALHIASLAGQSVIVTILVEHGANVNVQSLNGFSPLYMAAQENHEDVVRFLLSHGANQALATEDGFTPLAVALQQGHDRIVAILLENDTRGKVRLPALHIAAKKDDTKAATLLLQNEHNADVTSKSGFTPLHIAAHYGHENIARLLIERGANVNYQARHNITPLHVAAKWNRLNMCQLLLEHNADIKSQTKDLLTPLHCAARSGNDQVVDMLLNYKPPAPISAKTKNGLAPLHMAAQGDHVDSARILLYHRAPVDDITVDYLTPLHVAAHCGHVRVAKLLLDRNADPNARALNGFTPLHIACKKNRIKVVELLLKYHAAIEAMTESGLSPLHVAAFMGAINIVIYLLQQGANVDVATVRGETPLHLAARANQTDVVRVLIRNGAKVDAAARELQTPLHIASRLGNTDIVVLLLQAGANPNAATRDQYTPLHISAKEGQEEVAAILLDHQADKTLLTKKGFTPLHLASKYANLQVVKLLLERGTPVDIEGKNQVTPLHVASHYNNDKVAMLLLENGASAKATAKNGYTPLHISAKKNQMEIASILLQYQADPNAKSRAGFSPLHLSAQEGHKEMSSMLIENGSDVGAKANNGLTAMHLCAQEDRVPVAEVLYKNGAEINAKTKAGYTPLHVACHFGQLNMVRFLIEHGADVGEKTQASYTPLHQAAQQGHNNCVRYLLENGASPNAQNAYGQTPLSIAQRLGYVSVVETLKTVTETTVITETTVQPHEEKERYKPQNPEAMNETMFSESEDEGAVAEHEAATAAAHAKDFSDNLTKGLADSTAVHMIHTGEQLLSRSAELEGKRMSTGVDGPDNLEEIIRRAQAQPVSSAAAIHESYLDHSTKDDNIPISHNVAQPSFLISFLVDARGGAMRGCRHSGVRIIVPPRKASQPIRVTCRYLRKDKLAHPPPLSEGEELASRILEMAPAGAKFLGPVILEVPHFASLRDREREIVILRSDDGQHWKEHQLEATEDAVQEVLNESFDAEELAQLDDLHTPRITRILTSDFPMYFAVVTRIRQEVHCVGPEGGVIISSVVPRVQAIFPDGSLTKTIKVSVQAQPVPHEMVTRLHGNRVAVSPIVTVEPRRRKFHKPITLCIPIPQSNNKAMLTQYSGQAGQEPPTLRLLCSITGGSAPAQWEDITGTTQLTFTGDEVSFTTTVSARFWLMDCQTPRDAARMAQEVYNEAIAIPYMAKFVVFARRTFPVEGQLRVFCMTDDKEDKTLEKQEHFKMIAKSRDVEVLKGKHQFLEFAGNLVPVTKSGDQLSLFFLPFQENRLAFMVKTRNKDDAEAATEGRIAFMKEPKIRSDALPPQQPICTLAISLPEYTGDVVYQQQTITQKDATPFGDKYRGVLDKDLPGWIHSNVLKSVGADWPRLARALELPHSDIQYLRHHYPTKELPNVLKIWLHLKKDEANPDNLNAALHRIGREDIVRSVARGDELDFAYTQTPGAMTNGTIAPGSLTDLKRDSPKIQPPAGVEIKERHHVEPHYEHRPVVEKVVVAEARQSLSKSRSKSPEPKPVYVQEPVKDYSPVPEEARVQEPEQEETVSEVRTVVRTERHVHDTEEGPMVEEKIITTTYEDDVAVNESVEDRTVPLNEEEMRKWQELNQIVDQPGSDLKEIVTELPEGVEQETRTERHVEDDGTVVTTVVTTSRFSDSPSPDRPDSGAERPSHEASKHEPSGEAPGGTTQKKETAEEGFTDEDGSVIVSKKMTRVVTTTRTQLPGDDSSSAAGDDDETRSRSEDEQSVKSVREKIAMFEQQFAGDKPLKQYEYKKPEMYREEEEEEFDSGPLQETAELVQEAKRVTEDRPERIAEAVMGLGEAAVGVAGIDNEDEQSPEKKARHTTSHETTTTYSLARKRQGKDYEPGDEYEETGEHEGGYPTAMDQRYEIEEELRRAQATQAAPEAAPRRISAPSAEVPQYDVTAGSDEDVEAETRIIREEEPRYDDSERRLEEIAEGDEYPSPRMRRTSSTEPTFTTYRHEAEPVEVREEIDVRMLPSGDTVISEKDTFVRRESHEESLHRRESDDEEKEGSGRRAVDFMKKAGKIAGAAIAAPVVLAGMGAAKAYDAMKGEASTEEHRRESGEWPTAARRESQESEDREPRMTTQREEVTSYTLSRKHEGRPDESGIEAETEEELHRQIEPEVTESYTRRESIDEQGHPITIETSTHTEIRRFSAAEGEGPEELTSKPTTKEFTRTVDKDFDGNTVITETTTRLIQHSPEMDRREKIEKEEKIDRISPQIEEAEVEEITTVTTTTITQRPSITSFDTEGEGQRAIREEEPYPKESEFSRIEEIEPSGRSAVMIESVTRRRSSEQIDEEPAEEETRFTRKVEQEPDGEIIITETTSVSRTKRLSQGDTDLGDVEPQDVSTIIQGPPEFTEEQETEGEYKTEEIRTSTSIERQPSGDMIVTETKTTTTIIHQPPEVEGVIRDVQDVQKLTPEDLAPHGGATIKRSSEHEDLSHIGLSEPRRETETDIDADLISAEQLSGRAASEGREEEKISPEESPQRRLSEPDEHERSLTSTRESFEVPSHVEESQLSHTQKMHEELSIPDFEAPKYKDESESDVALPQSTQERRESSESEGEKRESRGEKALGFMKKAGKIAGAAIAAPVVLAGMGAVKAYDALRPDEKEEVQVTPQYEQELSEQFERHEPEHRKPIDEAYEEHGIVQRQESHAEEPKEPSSIEVERRYEERPQIHMHELNYEQTPSYKEQIPAKERTGSTESLKGSDTEKPESGETYSRTVEHRPDGSEVITETTVITEPSVGDEGETEGRVIKETVITSMRKLSGDEQQDRAGSPSFEETKYERREEIEPDGDVIITEMTTTTLSHAEDVPSHEMQTHGVPVEPISHVYERAERRGPSPSEFEIRESYEDRSPVGVERRGSFYEEDQKLVPESPTKQEDVSEEFKEILQSGPRDSDIQSHVYIEQEKASSPVQEKRRDSFYQEEQKLEPESPYTQEDVSEEFRKIISEGPTESEIQHHERKKSPSPAHEKRRDSFYQEEQKLEPESPYTQGDISEEFRETLSQGPSESELRYGQREKSPSPVHEKRRDSFYQEEQKLEPESPTGHDSIPEEVKNIIETTAVIEELASREQSGEPELERSSTTEMTSSVSTVIRRSIGSEEAEGHPTAEHDELTHVIESRRYSDEEMERTPARDVVDIEMKYSGDQHRRPSADDGSEEDDEDKPDRGGGRAMEFMKKAGKIAGAAVAAPVALAGIGAMKAYDALKRGDSEEGLTDVKPLQQQSIVCHEPGTDRPIYETERRTEIHHEPGMIESESYDRELGEQEITHEERPAQMPLASPMKKSEQDYADIEGHELEYERQSSQERRSPLHDEPKQHHIVERGESPSHIVESTSYEETEIFTRSPQQEEQHQVVDTDVSPAHIVESASYQEEREAGPPSPVPSQKSETSEKSYELEFIRKGAIRQQMVMSSDVRQKVPQQAEPYVSKSERSRLMMHGDEAIPEAQHIEYVTKEEPTGHIIESQEYSFPEEAEGEPHRKIGAPKSPAPSESSDQEGEKLLAGDESDEKEEEGELRGEKKKSGGGALAFMKKAGKIAGAAIAAPVVLAGVGAAKAYEAIKKDDQHKDTSYDYYRSPEHPEEEDYGEKESHRDDEGKPHIVESESYERTFRDESKHRDAEQLIGEPPKHLDSAHTQPPSQIESHEYIIGESPFESKMEEDTKREGYVIESEEYELPHSQDVDRPLSPPYHEPRDEVEMRRERAIGELHEKPEETPADDRYSENYIIDSQPSQPIAGSHIVESQSYQSELREGGRSPSPERRISEDIQVSKSIEMPEEGDEQQHFIESLEYRTQPIETTQSESIHDEQLHKSQPAEELHGTSYEDRPRIDDYELDYDKSSERFRDDLPTEMSKELTTETSHYSEEGGLKSPTNTPSEESRSIIGETYGEIGGGDGESRGEKALGFMKKAGQIAGAAIAAPVVLAGVGAAKAYEAIRGEKDEEFEHEVQESPHAPPAEQSERRSSLRDDEHTIAGGDDGKYIEQIEQIDQTPIHAFSETLATDVMQQAKQTAVKDKVFLKQESCQEIAMEPEIDYHSDLQEKLDILANEKSDKLGAVREEEDGDQLEIIKESEKEADDVIDNTANRLVADVLAEVLEQPDGGRVSRGSAGNESHPYYTATEPSTRGDEQYDTCVTSQEDAYESAQGWTSQDSEYTTATSGATSRLSETDEARQETSTPLAVLSPVDSDRQFTVSQDYEGDIPTVRIDKRFDIQDPNTARSTPDVPIQVTIEEEVEDDENLPTSPSGVLLAPQVDPGRPVSPIPPRPPTDEDDESAFTFVARPSEEELIRTPSGGATSEEQAEMHERAMDDMTYSRQLSDVSSAESRAETIIHKKQQDEQSDVVTDVEDLSMAELSETPGSFRQDTQSEKGSDAESGYRMIEPSIVITEDEPTSEQNVPMESEEIKPSQTIEETEEGFVVYRPDIDEEAEKKEHHHHEQHGETPEEELETVEEEPEDGDSLNEHGSGSGGSSAAGQSELSKYKHVSSDNVSLTSLQEFERLEQVLAGRGAGPESVISSSELELLAKLKNGGATTLSNGSNEGSISSLAEFEKLEAEITAQQAAQREAQAQGEEVMMLSDIREESEAEDMSVQEDDEMEETSDAEARTKPISQRATPTAPSEADSLERNVMTTSDIILLETSTDSLEPSGVMKSEETHKAAPASGAEGIEQKQQKRSPSAESLEGFEVVSKMQESTKDSLENIAQEKDSLLEGASQEMASQDTHAMLSADTLETYEEGDKDSLSGDMDNMLDRYPTTLTTFETTTVTPDGTVQTISRRVETRVRDPVMSHVTFTGTESEERLQELGEEEAFETVDSEGNVTRTTYRRYSPTGKH